MNHLQKIKKLNNQYFILRHGQAESNVKKIIAGDPKTAKTKFGITKSGRKSVIDSLKKFKELSDDAIIFSSDFLRTRQTSAIVAHILKIKNVQLSTKLRERGFGKLNGQSSKNYEPIRQADIKNPNHKICGVESSNEIMDRMTKFVRILEHKYKNKTIILISHGDPLQILRVAFMKKPVTYYAKIKYLKTGTMKKLKFK